MSNFFRGREIIGQGMEHIVLRPNGVNHTVLKVSRVLNRLSFWPHDPTNTLRSELDEAQKLISGTSVGIPRTEIHRTNSDNFVIRQNYVAEDGSVSDIGQHLEDQGLNTLLEEYRHEPRNFIGSEGTVYWIDPTKGTAGRILERTGIMSLGRYRIIRRKMSRIIRTIGL